jgi:hypothetical protein
VQISGTSTSIDLLAPPDWSERSDNLQRAMFDRRQLQVRVPSQRLFIFDPSNGRKLSPDR